MKNLNVKLPIEKHTYKFLKIIFLTVKFKIFKIFDLFRYKIIIIKYINT